MPISPQSDWLSNLVDMVTVTGRLEIRCAYGAPWRITYGRSDPGEMPFHVVVSGRAILEDPDDDSVKELAAGDIVMLPHGSAHVLHDGSGRTPASVFMRAGLNFTVSENDGAGEHLDMLCGRFVIAPPHDRFIRDYLPTKLVARAVDNADAAAAGSAARHLANLVGLMRVESSGDKLGGHAMLNALSSALFTLAVRTASESASAPMGLLALAGFPRLAPAISAMFNDPAGAWTLPELAGLCNMSRATFMRHFQDKLGRSANDLLTDIRMSIAANELRKPSMSAEAVAYTVGYQSVSAFRRVFAQRMEMTPGEWRQKALSGAGDSNGEGAESGE